MTTHPRAIPVIHEITGTNPFSKASTSAGFEYMLKDSETECTLIVPIVGRPGVAKELPETAKLRCKLVDEGKKRGCLLSLGWDFPEAGTSVTFSHRQALFGMVACEDCSCGGAPYSADNMVSLLTNGKFKSETGNNQSVFFRFIKQVPGPWPRLFRELDSASESQESAKGSEVSREEMEIDAFQRASNERIREGIAEKWAKSFAMAEVLEKVSNSSLQELMARLELSTWDPDSNPFQMVIEEFFPAKALFEEIGGEGVSRLLDYENGAIEQAMKTFLSAILLTETMSSSTKNLEEGRELLRLRLQSKVYPFSSRTDNIEPLPGLTVRFWTNLLTTTSEEAERLCGSLVGMSSFLLMVSSTLLLEVAPIGNFDLWDRILAGALAFIENRTKGIANENAKENRKGKTLTMDLSPITEVFEEKRNEPSLFAPKASPKENSSSAKVGALKKISFMSVNAMKKELKSYGIPTETFIEKSELADALEQARSAIAAARKNL